MHEAVPETFAHREKIMQLQQAIFYIYNEAGDKIPVALIHTQRIDDNGDIWFTIERSPLYTDNNFYPAELSYYKKGMPYYINVSGVATIESVGPLLIKFETKNVEHFVHKDTEAMNEYLRKLPVIKYFTHHDHHPKELGLG